MVGFQGFQSGGVFHKAIPPRGQAYRSGWRVRTYAAPMSAAIYIATGIGRGDNVSARFDDGTVPILVDGRLVDGALVHLAPLLSDHEVTLLQLFGVDLRAFAPG